MTQSKTVVCPSCGANSTNYRVCDYCGSRIAPIGDDVNMINTEEPYSVLSKMLSKRIYFANENSNKAFENDEGLSYTGLCYLDIWDSKNYESDEYAIQVIEPYDSDIKFGLHNRFGVLIAARKGSMALNTICGLQLNNLHKVDRFERSKYQCMLWSNDEHIYTPVLRLKTDINEYDIFYCDGIDHKGLEKNETADIIKTLFNALNVDEYSLYYLFWFTDAWMQQLYNAEGKNTDERPEPPLIGIMDYPIKELSTSSGPHPLHFVIMWLPLLGMGGMVAAFDDGDGILVVLGITGFIVSIILTVWGWRKINQL